MRDFDLSEQRAPNSSQAMFMVMTSALAVVISSGDFGTLINIISESTSGAHHYVGRLGEL